MMNRIQKDKMRSKVEGWKVNVDEKNRRYCGKIRIPLAAMLTMVESSRNSSLIKVEKEVLFPKESSLM